DAFPEATIDFRLNRPQSEQVASAYLKQLNLAPPADYRHAGRFGYDGLAKTYLEKELGVDGARPYLGHPIRLWYWQHRWFKPSTKEEFSVFVSPEGEIVRLRHDVEENAEGVDLPEVAARPLAEDFLFRTMEKDSTRLTFIESERIGRPHRADWTFTYRITEIEPVAGSEYRYEVTIIGDRIGGYREFLHVPEAWRASFSKLRSYNEMAGNFSSIGFLLTAIAIVAVIFIRIRRRTVQWRIALAFGIIAAALTLLNQINDFPLELYGYDTTASWSGFLLQRILIGLIMTLGSGLLIFLLTASAEAIYRERYGQMPSLPRMFTPAGLRTKSAFKGILLGVTLTSFFFAYQIAFYLIAGKFGAWSPSDVPYDNLLNTAMPWLAVLAIGFFPAVSEEFMSRMFSIPFLQKAFRNRLTWLALLIPAVIWGFGHAGYPNQPFWIRGAEVGFAGIIIGIIMLRYGILACLVWHYTVDALYTAFLLFRSENLYFVITAAVATGLLVIPLLLALIAYIRKGSFLPETGLLNNDISSPLVAPPEPEKPPLVPVVDTASTYQPLPSRNRILALAFFVVGVIAVLIPVSKIGDFLEYPISREAAIQAFSDTLRATGWADPDTLQKIAVIDDADSRGVAFVYLLKHSSSIDEFNRVADQTLRRGGWRVQEWVPENRLRFSGVVHGRTGEVLSVKPWLPEEMPGDSLSEDSARAMVEAILQARGVDLSALTMKEHHESARPHRLDHDFIYEAVDDDPRHIAEAKYRIASSINGDWVTVFTRPFYKIPEEWQRAREATTAPRAIMQGLNLVAFFGLGLWAIFLLASVIRRGLVPWKRAFLFAIPPAVIAALGFFNEFYLTRAEYFWQVEQPWAVFRTTEMTNIFASILGVYIFFAVVLALLGGLFHEQIKALNRRERKPAVLDAIIAILGGIGFMLIWRSANAWANAGFPHGIIFMDWDIPEWMATSWPVFSMARSMLVRVFGAALMIGVLAYLWNGPARKPILRTVLVLGILFIFMPATAVEPAEWLMGATMGAVFIVLAFVFLRFFINGRAILFVAAILGANLFDYASKTITFGNWWIMVNGWMFAIIAVILMLFWLFPRGKTN
ncbi:MAG: hypothetical protein ACOZB3_00030, partial [Calditrichota bacterium]